MTLRLAVLRLVRGLSVDRSERRRLGAAVVKLLRQRRRSLSALGPLLRVAPTGGKAKLQMWQTLACSFVPITFRGRPLRRQAKWRLRSAPPRPMPMPQ